MVLVGHRGVLSDLDDPQPPGGRGGHHGRQAPAPFRWPRTGAAAFPTAAPVDGSYACSQATARGTVSFRPRASEARLAPRGTLRARVGAVAAAAPGADERDTDGRGLLPGSVTVASCRRGFAGPMPRRISP